MVELVDGTWLAHLGAADMRPMIQYCLLYPERAAASWTPFDPLRGATLRFAPLDEERYPCFRLALAAARSGGSAPAVLNAANEVAVSAFLAGRIRFTDIPAVVEETLAAHVPAPLSSLDDALAADAWGRAQAERRVAARGR
jgi:1-deoxy-D-xylulose-5-phosphate reductoisomerase